MLEVVIILLLIVIILMLSPPEVSFYLMFGILGIAAIVCIVFSAIAFIHDPTGFILALIYHNPIAELTNGMLDNAMPIVNNISVVK
jgi:hypothetical protein